MNKVEALLAEKEYILLDGAMGTMLFAAGLQSGDPPEEWNVKFPERVRRIHREYIQAGSDIILTNSFGGNRFRLKLHGLGDQVKALNQAAAELARAEADSTARLVIVAGSVGPTGELLQPMGTMTFEEARAAFAEQAEGLLAGGVDMFWVETMSDLNEVRAAIEGIRSVSDLPISATMSFDTKGHTMMGVSPVDALEALRSYDLMAIGANCGNGVEEVERAVAAMHRAHPEMHLIAKPNAGIPKWVEDELVYDGTPALMAGHAQRMHQLGAQFVGGCCGSTPEHIRAMAESLKNSPEAVQTDEFSHTARRAKRATRARPRRYRRGRV